MTRVVTLERWATLLDAARGDERLVAESFEREGRGRSAKLPADLPATLAEALGRVGIKRLHSHQLAALRAARRRDAIVTTGTASGKSLCFNLPVLEDLIADPKARALYLYPTKALAQDQARKLSELAPRDVRFAIYDGDTPREERPAIRRTASLLLSNPDMLHMGILPRSRDWAPFLAGLKWIVLDEAHVYRGVFGSHVANVLRRLRRLAVAHGADPRFILTSATIANPSELAERLTGKELELISEDGSPSAGRHIAMWNPPLLDERTGRRRSALSEAADLLADLVISGVRTICFLRSRRGIELIRRFTELRLNELGRPELAERVAPYRAGYTPAQRRDIERRLADGELLAVVATNALELGIDIGSLDAAICVSFPGTVASLRQMWGRAGRERRGLAVYIAGQDALDQFFCRHPDEFLDRPVESAILDHESEQIYMQHLVAAAYERPLSPEDSEFLGPRWQGWADRLVTEGELRRFNDGRYGPRGPGYPAGDISLRSSSADNVAVVERDAGELIGTVEAERALYTLHPGAVYLHMGRSYEVHELDFEVRRALVTPFTGDWYTQPKSETDVFVERILDSRPGPGCELFFGTVSVSQQVIAYQRKSVAEHEVVDLISLDLPEQSFLTQALWYVPEDDALAEMPLDMLLGSLHAAEHSQIAVLPLIAMCDRWDIGGLSTNVHPQTGAPTIFIYDGHPGGVGIARHGFREFERLVGDALRLVAECPCEAGCPSCVQSPKCGNLNEPLHKAGAVELMGQMLD